MFQHALGKYFFYICPQYDSKRANLSIFNNYINFRKHMAMEKRTKTCFSGVYCIHGDEVNVYLPLHVYRLSLYSEKRK